MAVPLQELKTLIQDAKDWIAHHENLTQIKGAAQTITATEIDALRQLRIRPATPPLVEPDAGPDNWIGKLQEHNQAMRSSHVLQYAEESVPGPNGTFRWTCTVLVAEQKNTPFPRPADWESLGHTTIPSFGQKKKARQWAAKCAIKWLFARAPPDSSQNSPASKRIKKNEAAAAAAATATAGGGSSTSMDVDEGLPAPAAPTQQTGGQNQHWFATPKPRGGVAANTGGVPVKTEPRGDFFYDANETTTRKPSTPMVTTPIAPIAPPYSAPANTSTTGLDLEDAPFVRQVQELCPKMNLRVPKYVINRNAESMSRGGGQLSLYDGYADWTAEVTMPRKLGDVRSVLTQKACKERIAEEVMKVLLGERERRKEKSRQALAAS